MRLRRILCAVDFSEGSREALRVAASLSQPAGGSLVLVHVWQPPIWLTTAHYVARVDAAERRLLDWQTDARELGVSDVAASLVVGTPWERIVSFASTGHHADLIVMGTHRRVGLDRALAGSVSEQVIRHAPCPVLVVPAHDASRSRASRASSAARAPAA
jgi:nucleotide-binding universal stress UspA family protein